MYKWPSNKLLVYLRQLQKQEIGKPPNYQKFNNVIEDIITMLH